MTPLEKQYLELKDKYNLLVALAHKVNKLPCSLIAGKDCLSCKAAEVLRKIGENDY